jgi:hypothetical protein
MIDPKEIRPGNWVLKITGTDINSQSFFEYKSIEPADFYFTFAKDCFPIKITPSILGKSGFKHEFGDWHINRAADDLDDGFPFLRYNHTDNCWYLEKVKLWSQPIYVHQLQNLFYALSKEELNIEFGHFPNMAMVGPIDFFVKPNERSYRTRVLM